MLNTDIELAFDIDVDNTGKGTQCVIGNVRRRGRQPCKEAPTKKLVDIYARVGKRVIASYIYRL